MSYTKTAHLPVTPDEAFALVTEPERLRRWKTVSAVVDLRAGGAYRFTVIPGHVAAGHFRVVEAGRRIVFGWGWEGDEELPPDASTVTVTIEPADGGSLVTLVHEGLSDAQAAMHAEGWTHFFERLERLATTGDAGLDEWAATPQELTPVTASESVLAALQPVLRALTTEDRTKQTPCADFTCHELVEHLFDSLVQLGAMAGATVVNPEQGSLENRVSVMAAQAIDGWRDVDLGGSVPGDGGRDLPATSAAGVLPVELALHGWDIAQASGQHLRLSDEVVAYLRTLAEGFVPAGRGNGAFGPEVVPGANAGALDRLAAFSGRTAMLAPTPL
jgi:uncharacterized protein (TIGR03086 family)